MFDSLTNTLCRMRSVLRKFFRDSSLEPLADGGLPPNISEIDDLSVGLAAFDRKDYSAALSALGRVGDTDPARFSIAQVWLGITYLKAGSAEMAIAPLRRASLLDEQLGRDPLTIAECHFTLGLAYARTGRDESALAEFRNALRRQPGWGSVLFEIARVHAHRNRAVDSIAALAAAAQEDVFFLNRAYFEGDFATVRQAHEFQQLAAAFEVAAAKDGDDTEVSC